MSTDPWGAPPEDPWATNSQPPAQDAGWGGGQPAAPQYPAHHYEPPSQEDMLGGKTVRSFSFDGPAPIWHGGPITEIPPAQQQRNFDTNELEFWQDGKPKWVMPVYCQTAQKDDAEDDGVRSHYLSYKKLDAVKAALKTAGAARLDEGGFLALGFTGGGPKDRSPSATKYKQYKAFYAPPGAPIPDQVRQLVGGSGSFPAAPPAQSDPWQGLAPATVTELVRLGYAPADVLPKIQSKSGWQGAPVSAITGVVGPPPGQAQAGVGWGSDEPPF